MKEINLTRNIQLIEKDEPSKLFSFTIFIVQGVRKVTYEKKIEYLRHYSIKLADLFSLQEESINFFLYTTNFINTLERLSLLVAI